MNLANKLEWDSNAKALKLYSGNHLLATVDGTTWVKDGMVESVAVVGNNLEITFNTDSGKEKISVPLTDIFNPDNYYNKTEMDSKFENVSISDEYVKSIENVQSGSVGEVYLKVKTNKNTEGTLVSLPYLGSNLYFNSEINKLFLENGQRVISQVDLSPLKGTKASVSGDTLVLA